jgi:1,4-alpha-glucan branching enzyme
MSRLAEDAHEFDRAEETGSHTRRGRKESRERITLEACFPTAKKVLLAGSFNDWRPAANPLQKQGDGRWIAELELERGRYEYRFVVDGDWTDDPMACFYAVNLFGTLNGVLLVS